MSEQPKSWREMLEEIGGWDNELVSVPAGAVRKIIEELETMRNALVWIEAKSTDLKAIHKCREILK